MHQGGSNFIRRQAEARQPQRVQRNAQDTLAIARKLHVGHTVDGYQHRNDVFFDQPGKFLLRQRVAEYREVHDGLRVIVGFHDNDLLDAFRQSARYPAHRFPNVGGSGIEIRARTKFDVHSSGVFLGSRAYVLDARDPRHCALEQADHFGIHGFRRCAGVAGTNGHKRSVDIRKFTYFDSQHRGDACKHNEQIRNQYEYRSPHTHARKTVRHAHGLPIN